MLAEPHQTLEEKYKAQIAITIAIYNAIKDAEENTCGSTLFCVINMHLIDESSHLTNQLTIPALTAASHVLTPAQGSNTEDTFTAEGITTEGSPLKSRLQQMLLMDAILYEEHSVVSGDVLDKQIQVDTDRRSSQAINEENSRSASLLTVFYNEANQPNNYDSFKSSDDAYLAIEQKIYHLYPTLNIRAADRNGNDNDDETKEESTERQNGTAQAMAQTPADSRLKKTYINYILRYHGVDPTKYNHLNEKINALMNILGRGSCFKREAIAEGLRAINTANTLDDLN